MTLYLKYRPQTVSELDLTSVRERLTSLLSKESMPHAFLFAGPRGTGKTSSARILAKAINCENKKKGSIEPCNECETCISISNGNHIDVIEMDAASNRGIDEIRSLKQDVLLSPSIAKKKVYIIDEVHMLTTEAANAFLKTLEEPPDHVVFILATTDPQKLPQTVISRLSVIPFTKATKEEISKKLKFISEKEKIEIDDAALGRIAQKADGSFRDAVKTLEEISIQASKINEETIDQFISGGVKNVEDLLTLIFEKSLSDQISFIENLNFEGVDSKAFLNSLTDLVHEKLLIEVKGESSTSKMSLDDVTTLLELLLEIKAKPVMDIFVMLEVSLIKFDNFKTGGSVKKVDTLPRENLTKATVPVKEEPKMETQPPKAEETVVEHKPVIQRLPEGSDVDASVWAKILLDLRSKNAGVEALLRAAKPLEFDGSNFTVGVFFKFHKEKLETPTCQLIFEEVLKENFGSPVKVLYELTEAPKKVDSVSNVTAVTAPMGSTPGLTQEGAPDIINAAKEIFGN